MAQNNNIFNPAQSAIGIVSGLANLYKAGSDIAARRRQMGQDDRRLGLAETQEQRMARQQGLDESYRRDTFEEGKRQFGVITPSEIRHKNAVSSSLEEATTQSKTARINTAIKAQAEMEINKLNNARKEAVRALSDKLRKNVIPETIDKQAFNDIISYAPDEQYVKLRSLYPDKAKEMDSVRISEKNRLTNIAKAKQSKSRFGAGYDPVLEKVNTFLKAKPYLAYFNPFSKYGDKKEPSHRIEMLNKIASMTPKQRLETLLEDLDASDRNEILRKRNMVQGGSMSEKELQSYLVPVLNKINQKSKFMGQWGGNLITDALSNSKNRMKAAYDIVMAEPDDNTAGIQIPTKDFSGLLDMMEEGRYMAKKNVAADSEYNKGIQSQIDLLNKNYNAQRSSVEQDMLSKGIIGLIGNDNKPLNIGAQGVGNYAPEKIKDSLVKSTNGRITNAQQLIDSYNNYEPSKEDFERKLNGLSSTFKSYIENSDAKNYVTFDKFMEAFRSINEHESNGFTDLTAHDKNGASVGYGHVQIGVHAKAMADMGLDISNPEDVMEYTGKLLIGKFIKHKGNEEEAIKGYNQEDTGNNSDKRDAYYKRIIGTTSWKGNNDRAFNFNNFNTTFRGLNA